MLRGTPGVLLEERLGHIFLHYSGEDVLVEVPPARRDEFSLKKTGYWRVTGSRTKTGFGTLVSNPYQTNTKPVPNEYQTVSHTPRSGSIKTLFDTLIQV